MDRMNQKAMDAVDFSLSNPEASKESKALMNYLKGIYGKHMMTGQHTSAAEGPELQYIQEVTGKLPALRGFDLLSYSLATDTDNSTADCTDELKNNQGSIEKAIEWGKEKKGIVTLTWHWFAPLGGEDKTFYTKNADFDLSVALTPNTKEHTALIADLDVIAEQLKKLKDEKIPVLWRPLHEADGGWFWWGAKGAEAYKQLYLLMYDRYTKVHKLNNLIWVWNAAKANWYPGHEYVDIASVDAYVSDGDHQPLQECFDNLKAITQGKKPMTLGENGPIPDPDRLIESRIPWLWYMTWFGGFVLDGKATSEAMLKKIYDHPYTITLDELPDLKQY